MSKQSPYHLTCFSTSANWEITSSIAVDTAIIASSEPEVTVYCSLSALPAVLITAIAFCSDRRLPFDFGFGFSKRNLVECQDCVEILLFLFAELFALSAQFEYLVHLNLYYLLCLVLCPIPSFWQRVYAAFYTYLWTQSEHLCRGLRTFALGHHWNRFLYN